MQRADRPLTCISFSLSLKVVVSLAALHIKKIKNQIQGEITAEWKPSRYLLSHQCKHFYPGPEITRRRLRVLSLIYTDRLCMKRRLGQL